MDSINAKLVTQRPAKQQFVSAAAVTGSLKAINCLISSGFLIYFWASLGTNWKAVEFIQILFLSLLLVLVTVPLQQSLLRKGIALSIVVVTVVWLYLLAVLWARELNLPVGFEVAVFVCGMIWSLGINLACYLSERQNSNGEVDLILYLLTLNAVSAWSAADKFNMELHLLLDIRTLMLVYNCLHQLQKNEDLLRYPSFLSVVTLTVATFLLSQALFGGYAGNATEAMSILEFVLFGIIGVILLVEVWQSGKLTGQRDAAGDTTGAKKDLNYESSGGERSNRGLPKPDHQNSVVGLTL
jgi:hypothetical protein